jgi:hypothetical protein
MALEVDAPDRVGRDGVGEWLGKWRPVASATLAGRHEPSPGEDIADGARGRELRLRVPVDEPSTELARAPRGVALARANEGVLHVLADGGGAMAWAAGALGQGGDLEATVAKSSDPAVGARSRDAEDPT